MDEKTYPCTWCKGAKPASEFYQETRNVKRDGLASYCKPCMAERQRQKRKNNPEQARAQGQRWRKANAARAKAVIQRWGTENAARKRAINQRWRQENPERVKANAQRWRQENLERVREIKRVGQQNYTARKAGLPGSFTAVEFARRCEEQQWFCAYCGCSLTKATATADHFVPISRPEAGATNEISNIVACCLSCNSRKQDRTGDEYLALMCRDLMRP